MPTIRDVAKHAGVAPVTVSRVINNSGYVSQETRQRVEAAVQELGYVPNMLGASLRFQKTMTLAVVITDVTNPFWTAVTRGIEDISQANGYSLILCNTDESEAKQAQYLDMLLRRRIDGIILVPASDDAEPIRKIQQQGVPVVVIDRKVSGVDVDTVRGDSEAGAYRLAKHLFTLGHRKIALLAGPENVSTAKDRVSGYFRALQDTCPDECDTDLIWGEYTRNSGYEMARQALSSSQKPTALFTGNNFIALGAQQYLHEIGLSIPQDIAMVTFGELPAYILSEPFFTADIYPDREMGKLAANVLFQHIHNESKEIDVEDIVLPTKTKIRASSGPEISVSNT